MLRQPLPKLLFSLVIMAAIVALAAVGLTSITTDASALRASASVAPVSIPAVPAATTPPAVGTEAFTRPLFHMDREPGPDKAPAAPVDATTTTATPAGDASSIQLKGIIIGERGARAALQAPGSGAPTWVGAGETIDGWKVESISADKVRIRNGDEVVEIKFVKDE